MSSIAAAVAFLSVATVADAQKKPAAPTNFCIASSETTCVAAKPATSSNYVKWNPGHYITAEAMAFPRTRDHRIATYDKIRNDPMFKGAMINIPWAQIEPREGEYDFTEIDHDLAYLKKMGKRLMLSVWLAQYGGTISPEMFPQWAIDKGGVKLLEGGQAAANLDSAEWMDKIIALYEALGRRYNSDPNVEQVVIGETAMAPASTEFKRLLPRAAKAFPNTATVFHMNWVSGDSLARELGKIAVDNGVGIGGPDIIPPEPISPYGEDHGSLFLRGAGFVTLSGGSGNYGTIDYRGTIPVAYEYQSAWEMPPSKLIGYALDTLKATHLIWRDIGYKAPDVNFDTGVLPAVRSVNGKTVTACPTAYQNRCRS